MQHYPSFESHQNASLSLKAQHVWWRDRHFLFFVIHLCKLFSTQGSKPKLYYSQWGV
jgi:hypothetical protein